MEQSISSTDLCGSFKVTVMYTNSQQSYLLRTCTRRPLKWITKKDGIGGQLAITIRITLSYITKLGHKLLVSYDANIAYTNNSTYTVYSSNQKLARHRKVSWRKCARRWFRCPVGLLCKIKKKTSWCNFCNLIQRVI